MSDPICLPPTKLYLRFGKKKSTNKLSTMKNDAAKVVVTTIITIENIDDNLRF